MFDSIVTDEKFLDENGNPKTDAAVHIVKGKMVAVCHPSISRIVKDGILKMIGFTLEIKTKDEWEKENNCEFGKSQGKETPAVHGRKDI